MDIFSAAGDIFEKVLHFFVRTSKFRVEARCS